MDDALDLIAHYINQYHCDQIVMGTRELGCFSALRVRSVVTQVLQLVPVLISFVKKYSIKSNAYETLCASLCASTWLPKAAGKVAARWA